jgi:hypothetical protein
VPFSELVIVWPFRGYRTAAKGVEMKRIYALRYRFFKKGQSANVKEKGAKNHTFLIALTEK